MKKAELPRWMLIVFMILIVAAKSKHDAYDVMSAIESGRTCYKGRLGVWSCIYKVGEDVEFKVGQTKGVFEVFIINAGSSQGDFYIPFDHTVFNVMKTKKGIEYISNFSCIPIRSGQYYSTAYVSPVDGRVFPDEDLCEDMTLNYFQKRPK